MWKMITQIQRTIKPINETRPNNRVIRSRPE